MNAPEIKKKSKVFALPFLVIIVIFGIYLFFSWFVSSPVRAAKIDGLVLYNTDEVFRYYFIRLSLKSVYVFVNAYVRPLYMLISSIFYNFIAPCMFSLRVMNVFFSCGTLYTVWRLAKKIGFDDNASILAILIIATNPIYFLHSISIQAASIFCFFFVLSIYLFYSKKYLLSVVVSSLLPLIRPEGYLSLIILPIFLLKERKQNIKYIILLFLPLMIWVLSNILLLGGGFLSRFFYQFLLQAHNVFGRLPLEAFALTRPNIVLTPFEFLLSSGHIIFVLFLIGLSIKLFDKQYLFLSTCFIAYFLFYSVSTIVVNFGFEKINIHGIMTAVSGPIIPFLGIFAVVPVIIFKKHKPLERFIIIGCAIIFIVSNLLQIVRFRQYPGFQWRVLYNSTEENVLKQAGSWLGKYAEKKGIKRLYISVDDAVHEFTNIFLLYLPSGVKFYMISVKNDNISSLDLETIKALPFQMENSLYLTGNKNVTNLNSRIKCELIKEFDALSLYFYSLDKLE